MMNPVYKNTDYNLKEIHICQREVDMQFLGDLRLSRVTSLGSKRVDGDFAIGDMVLMHGPEARFLQGDLVVADFRRKFEKAFSSDGNLGRYGIGVYGSGVFNDCDLSEHIDLCRTLFTDDDLVCFRLSNIDLYDDILYILTYNPMAEM